MQITRQADYALRAMLFLAEMDTKQRANGPIITKVEIMRDATGKVITQKEVILIPRAPTSEIAQAMKIPPSFLAKIISQLAIARLIHTSRGAHGGVSLSRLPEEISLLEVVEAIDGAIAMNECTNDPSVCPFGGSCPLHNIWCATQAELVERLRATTFAQLVADKAALPA
jgi:Rrf2 family protein